MREADAHPVVCCMSYIFDLSGGVGCGVYIGCTVCTVSGLYQPWLVIVLEY